ncbi:MAG: glycine betaine ABC transporter substrate-binding protein [Bacillota bacterium]|nr:ABC transporter substrate-binding protein [Clostridia bacterium]
MKKYLFKGLLLITLILLVFAVAGCGGSQPVADEQTPAEEQQEATAEKTTTITVSSKPWTENILLGQLLLDYLENNGYPVENQLALGETNMLRPALESGQIDVYWEYTSTLVEVLMKGTPNPDKDANFKQAHDWDLENNNIKWLDYAPLNDTYAFVANPDFAAKYNLKTASELVELINSGEKIIMCAAEDYVKRSDGLPHIEEVYGFKFPRENIKTVAWGLNLLALNEGEADINVCCTTDAKLKEYNVVILEDDKHAFPDYYAAPTFRNEIIETYPELPELVKKLSSVLDTETMIGLNYQVDVEGKSHEEVSRSFLQEKGLLK